MNKLLNLCVNTLSEVYHDITIKRADKGSLSAREALFKKLVAVWYGVTSMINLLGYTEEDVARAIQESGVSVKAYTDSAPKGDTKATGLV